MEATLFPRQVLDEAPLCYRYMHVFPSAQVKELYITRRFSSSQAHRSRESYLCHPSRKPVSNLFFAPNTGQDGA